MTNREFFTLISQNSQLPIELQNFAKQSLTKLNEENERKKHRKTQHSLENEELINQIITNSFVYGRRIIASEIANEYHLSTQKANAILVKMVDEGKLVQTEEKIPKRGLTKVYELASTKNTTENVEENVEVSSD
jgi:hypothetical protein